MTTNNARHYCNQACRDSARRQRLAYVPPVEDEPYPSVVRFIILVIVSAFCFATWGTILFVALPWIVR